jgi:tetratricopeptide (TPR) repeat protein
MIATAGLILLARHQVLGTLANPYPPLGATILWEIPRVWTAAATWPHVFRLFFFPLELSVDYGPAVIPIAFGWDATNVLGVILVLGALALSLLAWRRGVMGRGRASSRTVGWGVVWAVITLSPTSNLLFLSGILLAERTLYLPSVGFVAVAAWALLRLWEVRPRLAPALLLVALAFGVARSWTRTPVWENNFEVFRVLIEDHPEAGRSQWVLGDSYFTVKQFKAGLRAYRLAIGILGGHYNLMVGVSRNLIGNGYDRPAELLLLQAWEQRPEFGVAPGLLSGVYDRQGRYEEAEEAARYSLSKDSTVATHYHTLSRALQAQGRHREAIRAREGAIRHGEGDHLEQWVWLADLHFLSGDSSGARAALDSAALRANSTREARQFDSIMGALGLREEGGR